IEVVARVLEVVGVAAEESDATLGREDEADVGVLLVAIEVILPTLVERDHIAAEAGLVGRFLLNLRDGGLTGSIGLFGARPLGAGCVFLFRTEAVLWRDVQPQIRFFRLLLLAPGGVAGGGVFFFLGAAFLVAAGADVVVGEDDPAGGDKPPPPAVVEAH